VERLEQLEPLERIGWDDLNGAQRLNVLNGLNVLTVVERLEHVHVRSLRSGEFRF
jgi:hypothetical protein